MFTFLIVCIVCATIYEMYERKLEFKENQLENEKLIDYVEKLEAELNKLKTNEPNTNQ